MASLSKEEAQTILTKVLAFSKANECEVNISVNVTAAISGMHAMPRPPVVPLRSLHWS